MNHTNMSSKNFAKGTITTNTSKHQCHQITTSNTNVNILNFRIKTATIKNRKRKALFIEIGITSEPAKTRWGT